MKDKYQALESYSAARYAQMRDCLEHDDQDVMVCR